MTDQADQQLVDIQRELSLMIDEYGLIELLQNLSLVVAMGYLMSLNNAKLMNTALCVAFAAEAAIDQESGPTMVAFKEKDLNKITVFSGQNLPNHHE